MSITALLISLAFSISLNSGVQSNSYHFTPDTQNVSQKPFLTFGVIADLQYCNCDSSGTRFYKNSLRKAEEAVASFADAGVDFVVNLGDLIDRDITSYGPPMEIFNQSGHTFYHIPGNHDLFNNRKVNNRIPHIDKSQPYYSIVKEGIRLIFLDATDISALSYSKRSRDKAHQLMRDLTAIQAPYNQEYNGALGERQIAWLKQELIESKANKEHVILFCHNPIWPEGRHNLLNSKEILNILGSFDNIIAWMNGHNHNGSYGNRDLIHHITFKGMVETPDQNSYSIVEVYRNKIWINGYGREKSQILAY